MAKKLTEKQKKIKEYSKTYTKPETRYRIFKQVLNKDTHGTGKGKWSARKAQLLAKLYKKAGGGFKN